MNLKILQPYSVCVEKSGVVRMVVETLEGSLGILPRRLDGVVALAPGILIYETGTEGEVFVAVDEGVLVKSGPDVLVSVRRAFCDRDLEHLRESVEREFLTMDEQAQSLRAVMTRLESGFIRRLATFHHE